MDYENLVNFPEVKALVEQTARSWEIDPKNLWNMYVEVMRGNLAQDLDDIAQLNIDELKEMEN